MICKFYMKGKCKKNNCKFIHNDMLCKKYFFNKCTKNNCSKSHDFKPLFLKKKIQNLLHH